MSNGQMPNPLAAPLTQLKQMGAQSVQSLNSLNTGLINGLNQGLDVLISGAPPIPGLPGAAAAPGALPTPQALLPANLTQVLSQIENVLIPPGLPRPSQAMVPGAPAPTPPAPQPSPASSNARPVSGLRRITQMRGL